ncbi:LLM class flavin-dependent oxidoreductase [Chelatococcus reniformis]|uniref:Alkanesulfonate monooxygenase n=1 Tax=Chelatococcus reniformis TaxID=1494448 RepID=A0A916TX22_9HYPH|nr:LLM class flavin-dependent oxidoreductase [Chelatococcus reniformis]GGC49432.1 alkanesulfonate monooxygenase [Chelatococcus reniformis]
MSIDFIGFIGSRHGSEIHPAEGPVVDKAYIGKLAQAHEAGGFDRALIAFHSTSPDSLLVAAYAGFVTERLGLMIAHRPGFIAPTVAARQFATLDQLTDGRVAVHVITGGDDAELAQDGSFIGKDERYARTDEYLEVLKREWTAEAPFDHAGRFYRFDKAFSSVKSVRPPRIPLYFGGSSDAALEVGGKHADVYALWGETHEQVRETVERVRAAAARHGRQVRFSLSMRPILADTEEQAWARAQSILEQARALQNVTGYARSKEPANAGSQRLLAAAAQGARLDKRLWTELAALTGAKGNSTALVGTAEQVAEALRDYYDLGITTFLIRGFDPYEDTVQYGRELLPATRELIARTRPADAEAA